MPSVLFVCQGNICRSPAAEVVLRALAMGRGITDLTIDSCGVCGRWHIGAPTDRRMREALERRGYTGATAAKPFEQRYLQEFDLILASDEGTRSDIKDYATTSEQFSKILLMTEFSPSFQGEEIPDPYFDRKNGFEHALDMIEDLCRGLLDHLYKA